MSQTLKTDPLMLGIVLVVGAFIYSRSNSARAAGFYPPRTGAASMPGNVGTGSSQVVGGIIGSLSNLFNRINLNGFQNDTAVQVQPGTSYDPTNPAYVGGLSNLINGTVNDYYERDRTSYGIPTVNDIVLDVTNTTYGGDSGSFSVSPGNYWAT